MQVGAENLLRDDYSQLGATRLVGYLFSNIQRARGIIVNYTGLDILFHFHYLPGAVIVGSVDGNRIWGKDLQGLQLTDVERSPNEKEHVMFGIRIGEVQILDNTGHLCVSFVF